jgi:hypothetical protein
MLILSSLLKLSVLTIVEPIFFLAEMSGAQEDHKIELDDEEHDFIEGLVPIEGRFLERSEDEVIQGHL